MKDTPDYELKQELTRANLCIQALRSDLQAMRAEKEALIKRVHHRAKTDLTIVSSLLDLEADSIKGFPAKEVFQDSQNRIRAIALVHEKLCRSGNAETVDFGNYVEALVQITLRSFVIDPDRHVMRIEVPEIELGIDTAIPCGLIINELVSNAIKHAFSDGRSGEVFVGMKNLPDRLIELTVRDNGLGFPEEVDFRAMKSLGIQLVVALTRQLEGDIDLVRDKGTTFVIRFREPCQPGPSEGGWA
jgi:two-component sensor histidine kinase